MIPVIIMKIVLPDRWPAYQLSQGWPEGFVFTYIVFFNILSIKLLFFKKFIIGLIANVEVSDKISLTELFPKLCIRCWLYFGQPHNKCLINSKVLNFYIVIYINFLFTSAIATRNFLRILADRKR